MITSMGETGRKNTRWDNVCGQLTYQHNQERRGGQERRRERGGMVGYDRTVEHKGRRVRLRRGLALEI